MRINPEDKYAGYPMLDIRKLLRGGEPGLNPAFAGHVLGIGKDRASRLLKRLETDGYLTRKDIADNPHWEKTVRGNALAGATTAPPLRRATAERKLKELLGRVRDLDHSDDFSFFEFKLG